MTANESDPERIESRILTLRAHRVLLDEDLARLYEVPVKALNQAVKRNRRRFPEDFTFRLTPEEVRDIRSQIVTASRRNVRHLPLAFTVHGALMAANVPRSGRAVAASVLVVRAFVRLRREMGARRDLAEKLAELERRVGGHDDTLRSLMAAIRGLLREPDKPPREKIGFRPRDEPG
jgi:hypothetical protein